MPKVSRVLWLTACALQVGIGMAAVHETKDSEPRFGAQNDDGMVKISQKEHENQE